MSIKHMVIIHLYIRLMLFALTGGRSCFLCTTANKDTALSPQHLQANSHRHPHICASQVWVRFSRVVLLPNALTSWQRSHAAGSGRSSVLEHLADRESTQGCVACR